MEVLSPEWKGRIEHWIRVLKEDFYEPLGEISWSAYRTMAQISPDEVIEKEFMPVATGFTWGHTWEYCWFKSRIELPEAAKGKRIVMNLNPEGESTLFVNGRAFGTYRASWVSCPHHFYEDNVLTRCAEGGECFDILMETYAGHYFPCEPGTAETGPVLTENRYKDSLEEGKRRKLGVCTYGIFQEDAYQLYIDADTLYQLLQILDPASLRTIKIAKALKKFTEVVDFEQDRSTRIKSYEKARELLKPVLEAQNGSTVAKMYAVGNAHIDLAWLWPLEETHRKVARTFAAQLRLMEEYPDYKYIQSQPAAYEMCREYYPELFERIKKAIRKGQWIAEGAMWVEPDTNITGGEALIRQIFYGKKYYKDVLEVESEVLWLPDTFGYSAALPQIIKGCGIKYLVTQKIFASYSNEERFPYHYFNWEGIDGTRIVSFLPTSYLYQTEPGQVNTVWKHRVQEDLDAFLLPYGYGDGGGGPARDYIEYAERLKNLEGSVSIKLAGPNEFFEDIEIMQGPPENTYVGELYFCAHRGTYTTQAKVKKNNRKCELALREMEFFSSLAVEKGMKYDYTEAERMWKTLLLHQFHDILPGSSIRKVYDETEMSLGEVIKEADEWKKKAMRTLLDSEGTATGITVFHSLCFERRAVVSLPEEFAHGAKTKEGTRIAVQKNAFGLRAMVSIPSCGGVTLYPDQDGISWEEQTERVFVRKVMEGYCIENRKVIIYVNGRGEIISFVRKASGKEFVSGKMNCLRLYKDVPCHFDAWDIDSVYMEQKPEEAFQIQTEILAEGMEGIIRISGYIGHSEYTQFIKLAADSEYVEFEMKINWKELHRLLKVTFPTTIHAVNGINEIQFGYIERPAHKSRQYDKERFEVCNHRYSALCDGLNGVAVFNDCKYGISMYDRTLALTLLRAASSPEMRTDNGEQSFRYAFMAWEDGFCENDIVNQAYAFNVEPQLLRGSLDTFSAFAVDRKNIILDTVKPADDRSPDLILRFYEAQKAAVTVNVTYEGLFTRAWICDMLENKIEEIDLKNGRMTLQFKAFEIKTIRLGR